MELGVMLALLGAAALHAAWNGLIKRGSHTSLDTALVAIGAALWAAIALPFLPAPNQESWPYLGASLGIHVAYFSLLALSYRGEDLSYAYPLMRGSAPLFSAMLAALLLGETLPVTSWSGVLLLCGGILVLARDRYRSGRFSLPATGFSLANAAVIVAYTLVDGVGVRLSGSALGYAQWFFFLNGFPQMALAWMASPGSLGAHLRTNWHSGLLGGLFMALSYGIALWAMTRAPIGPVAALRETSVLFGTVFAAVFLHERFGRARYLASLLVAAGTAAMRFG